MEEEERLKNELKKKEEKRKKKRERRKEKEGKGGTERKRKQKERGRSVKRGRDRQGLCIIYTTERRRMAMGVSESRGSRSEACCLSLDGHGRVVLLVGSR